MAAKLTNQGAKRILTAFFDGGAVPTNFDLHLFTSAAGSVTTSTVNTSGITRSTVYPTTTVDKATNLATFGGGATPAYFATDQISITFTGAGAAINGYCLVDLATGDVILWDTITPFTPGANGDILKLTINPFNLV